MFDLTLEELKNRVIERSVLGEKLNPEETLDLLWSMIEIIKFLKNNLPTNVPTGWADKQITIPQEKTIVIWRKKRITEEEFRKVCAEQDHVYVYGPESPNAVNIASDVSNKMNNQSVQIRFIE